LIPGRLRASEPCLPANARLFDRSQPPSGQSVPSPRFPSTPSVEQSSNQELILPCRSASSSIRRRCSSYFEPILLRISAISPSLTFFHPSLLDLLSAPPSPDPSTRRERRRPPASPGWGRSRRDVGASRSSCTSGILTAPGRRPVYRVSCITSNPSQGKLLARGVRALPVIACILGARMRERPSAAPAGHRRASVGCDSAQVVLYQGRKLTEKLTPRACRFFRQLGQRAHLTRIGAFYTVYRGTKQINRIIAPPPPRMIRHSRGGSSYTQPQPRCPDHSGSPPLVGACTVPSRSSDQAHGRRSDPGKMYDSPDSRGHAVMVRQDIDPGEGRDGEGARRRSPPPRPWTSARWPCNMSRAAPATPPGG
jgi:hypothetical protein